MRIIDFLLNSRNQQNILGLEKNLRTKKGSRTGNSGNYKELQVLTRIHHVP
ncbi:uncharacterized protein isoform X2 [Leptinotarsa decemlineata]|uniref:uncharacterized protein isoform X2 n=1 Tax=Leptinotarsa decemlineata TaxID=7539 RepID=UPI000C252658|nr:uncharacterized protein LOC111505247 [Leptinotarsa decemlineata]